jgi:23S rRNA pseudouridine955/2504/2580 synthase
MNGRPVDFSQVQTYQVKEEDAGQRLDNFLGACLKGVPKSRIYRMLRKGEVRVNKGRVANNYRLCQGDRIRIPPVRVAERQAPTAAPQSLVRLIEDRILHEDDDLMLLNKPSGLAVHGGSGLRFGLIETVRGMRPDVPGLELVHRLDRDTSGCLLLAKKRAVLRNLHEQIRLHRMEKHYQALLAGHWRRGKRRVDAPLLKNVSQGGERMVRVDACGKPAQTCFSVIRRWQRFTLVDALLETGRTHQIRVHAAHLGTPICGDEKYADTTLTGELRRMGLKRLFLHAASLSFVLPGEKQPRCFSAPLDDELQLFLDRLGEAR